MDAPLSVAPPEGRAPAYPGDEAAWGKFHSKRFHLTVPLPDGAAWKIDDHRAPDLVAVHDATDSRLTVALTQEQDLMNRQRCEERARDRGWVPDVPLTTVDDHVHVGPEAYDSRVWVALAPGEEGGALEGHVFLFGAFIRRCLLVHLSTRVPSARSEEVLAGRLALGASRVVKAITIDPPRTTDDAVPRAAPNPHR